MQHDLPAPYWIRREGLGDAEGWHLIEHPPPGSMAADQRLRAACGERPRRLGRVQPLHMGRDLAPIVTAPFELGKVPSIATCSSCREIAHQLDLMHQAEAAALAGVEHHRGRPIDSHRLQQLESDARAAALRRLHSIDRRFWGGSDLTVAARSDGSITVGGRMWTVAEHRRLRAAAAMLEPDAPTPFIGVVDAVAGPPHMPPGQLVDVEIDGLTVEARISYAEAAVWDAGRGRIRVPGEEETRIVDVASVTLRPAP